MKVVILAISWKKFHGRAVCHTHYGRTHGFSWVNISWFASRPRKPRKYYPPPPQNTRYTVFPSLKPPTAGQCDEYTKSIDGGTYSLSDNMRKVNTNITASCYDGYYSSGIAICDEEGNWTFPSSPPSCSPSELSIQSPL